MIHHLEVNENELPSNGASDNQEERSVLVGKLVENHQSKHVKNRRRANLSSRANGLTKRLFFDPIQSALDARLEDLRCDHGNNTNNRATETIEEASEELFAERKLSAMCPKLVVVCGQLT